jgi:hypothetical protein
MPNDTPVGRSPYSMTPRRRPPTIEGEAACSPMNKRRVRSDQEESLWPEKPKPPVPIEKI